MDEPIAVPELLLQLEHAYQRLIAQFHAPSADAIRLLGVSYDLVWYAERLGHERWHKSPRSNQWSFAENLHHLVEQAVADAAADSDLDAAQTIVYYIDHGKEHVGQAAEIVAIFNWQAQQAATVAPATPPPLGITP